MNIYFLIVLIAAILLTIGICKIGSSCTEGEDSLSLSSWGFIIAACVVSVLLAYGFETFAKTVECDHLQVVDTNLDTQVIQHYYSTGKGVASSYTVDTGYTVAYIDKKGEIRTKRISTLYPTGEETHILRTKRVWGFLTYVDDVFYLHVDDLNTDMNTMFENCSSLESIDISGWDSVQEDDVASETAKSPSDKDESGSGRYQ